VADALDVNSNPAPAPPLRRLGRNVDGYHGETIDISAILKDCRLAAQAGGWAEECFFKEAEPLLAFVRSARANSNIRRLYISTGIHGDEPAGPLAVRRLLREDAWPDNLELYLCPCLNPDGFKLNQRENVQGLDLNRQYRDPQVPSILAHTQWLRRQPRFDLCLCLHEDWESHGFYLYELNPENRPSLAEAIVAQVATVCPIDPSELIEGRAARGGIIRPSLDPATRPQWAEAFFLILHQTRLSYTLEAPSDFALSLRVDALSAGVTTACRQLAAASKA
jgi:predicted deacylase